MKQFFIDARNELKHVVWPSRARAISYALIIVAFSVLVGYVLFGFDAIFQSILKILFIK